MIDKINPPHYQQGKIEVIEFILDQKLNYLEGNCIKYLCRYKLKNGLEDLKKAQWYLNKLIEQGEGLGNLLNSRYLDRTRRERCPSSKNKFNCMN